MTCEERILSNAYADIMTDFTTLERYRQGVQADFCYQMLTEDLGILYLERSLLPPLAPSEYSYNYIPKCYGLMIDSRFDPLSLINSGILSLQGEPLELTGRGVTIGFIDTGIRYQQEVFRYSDGSTRIAAIWDQTIQTGNPPEGLQYGTEYKQAQINEALRSKDPFQIVPSTDEIGHGTAMASVAAASKVNNGLQFVGAAPDCDIVMVKLKEAKPFIREYYLIPDDAICYQESDIMSAIYYLDSFALNFRKPLVICIGLGTNMGNHTGASMLARYIDIISERKSRAIVIAGGNEGNAAHHFAGTLSELKPSEVVEIRVADGEKGFVTELWAEVPFLYTIAIRSPGGELIPPIFAGRYSRYEYSFVFEKTKIQVDFIFIEQASGEELIQIRFQDPTPGIWTVTVLGSGSLVGGDYHMWLPITAFLKGDTYFLRPDPSITLTEPCYARNAIGTSTYNDGNNSFYINSGRGFAKNRRIKPDIAAPGVNISTSVGKQTGSSLAASITAGGVAQLLQWAVVEENDILVDSNDIKNYLIRGASRDNSIVYPSREWGYGRLNMSGVFEWFASRGGI